MKPCLAIHGMPGLLSANLAPKHNGIGEGRGGEGKLIGRSEEYYLFPGPFKIFKQVWEQG